MSWMQYTKVVMFDAVALYNTKIKYSLSYSILVQTVSASLLALHHFSRLLQQNGVQKARQSQRQLKNSTERSLGSVYQFHIWRNMQDNIRSQYNVRRKTETRKAAARIEEKLMGSMMS